MTQFYAALKYVCFSIGVLGLMASSFAQDFKVLGYLPSYRFALKDDLAFDKLTHLYIAFANPDANGNLSVPGSEDPVIATARSMNPDLVVMVSLAGGALSPAQAAAYQNLMQPSNRSGFIHKIMEHIEDHDYDGIDVDLEWSHVDASYSPFVLELEDSVRAHGKMITAAWPATTRYADISNAALAVFDFINIMAYDLTGPWAPNNPGHHSPYSFAQQGINFWKNQGVTGDRLTLGVPFYGYDFTDQNNVSSFTFATIVNEDTALAQLDQDGQRYYNGIPTIEAKTQLAMDEVGGIMIWEIGQDALNTPFSLLATIDKKINGSATSLDDRGLLSQLRPYPNPFQDRLMLDRGELHGEVTISLIDLSGKIISQELMEASETHLDLNLSHLAPGFYLCRISQGTLFTTHKLVKR